MSVVIETTIGDFTVDLYLKERPNTCLNFLKLCKIKYYNFCLLFKVERNFIAQTGDPTATGRGGESIYSFLYGDQAKYFDAELKPRMKHEKIGTLSMVNNGGNMIGSQFFLTLGENLTYLDEVHTVFGEVAEGLEVLLKMNEIICDQNNRPYQDILITHTVILHDPYDDPAGLQVPDASPEPTKEMLETDYIAPDEELDDTKGKNIEEIEEKIKDSEAKARATILEMVGDIPDAEVKPPENVLFVCKLNPVTTSEDLELIFSRFGKIVTCEIIKDKKSGESLQYAFIEFEEEKDCENAYFKMDNVLIDDRRIHVDFSQSVSKLNWNQNKVGKGKPGRFQNFVLKSDAKMSDGYNMIFDMNEDNNIPKGKGKYRGKEKSHYSSKEHFKDKYSSRSRNMQVSERKYLEKHKSKRSPSPPESYSAKEQYSYLKSSHKSVSNESYSHRKSLSSKTCSDHKSPSTKYRLDHKNPSTKPHSHHKSPTFSKSSDHQSNKKAFQEDSYSSGSSPSPQEKNKDARYKETFSKDQHYHRSKLSKERPHSSDKTKNKSYDNSSRPNRSSHNKPDYRSARSKSPIPKNRRDRSSSSDENNYSKSHSKSIKKSKRKTSSSGSSEEYVSKKSSRSSDNLGPLRNYEKLSRHSSRKRSPSPQYSKMNKKSSPFRYRDEKNKHCKNNSQDSSDSDSYINESKLKRLNYKHSQKSSRRRRSSS